MALYGIVVIDKLKNLKLVVSDIDGTLLTSDNHLHPTTMGAVQFFEKNPACKFTFSTGRAFPRVKPMADLFNLQVPFIFSGGAIYDPLKAQPIFARPLSAAQIRRVQLITENAGAALIAHTTGKMYCQSNERDWLTISSLEWLKGRPTEHAQRVQDLSNLVDQSVIRLDVFSEEVDLVPIYHAVVGEVSGVYAVRMKRSIEITPEGIDKGSALQQLAAYIGISPIQIMAIGDSLNDMRLLDVAGIGVAMGDAPEVLKARADIIVPSSDNGGFAHVLDFLAWTDEI